MQFVKHHMILIVCVITSLQCALAESNGDLRLVSGNTTKGRVEIYYDFKWNTISDRFILNGNDVARVVCRQLGLPFTQAETVENVYLIRPGQDVGVLATTPFCDGTEARLTDCSGFSWSISQFYTHDDDLGVQCRGENIRTGDLRLADGSDRLRGRLEIYQGNAWGSFCSVGFGVTEATVACRQLGLLNSSDVVVYPDAYFGQGSILVGPYIAHCNGDEERIDSCPSFYQSFSSENFDELICSHSKDVGICCPLETGGCAATSSSGSVVGGVVSSIIIVGIFLLIIGCCCYCCCKKKKGKQQYTTVVQNPPPQPAAGGGPQVSMTSAGGNTAPPVYYHGSSPGYPVGTTAPPTQYPSSGQAMPPPAPAVSTPYPSQPSPYPSGQAPPPAPAGNTPYPPQSYPYPSGPVPPSTGAYPVSQQPSYNPTAAASQYPPQPAGPYPPQTSSMAPPYGAPSGQLSDYPHPQAMQASGGDSYPTKGDPDHPLPSHGGTEMPSAPPMDMSSGHDVAPSAPPPAYEHLIG